MLEGSGILERPKSTVEEVFFRTEDARTLRLRRRPPASKDDLGPLLLVHGAGVRSNIFQPPRPGNIDEALSRAGFDVWNLDWRASIQQPPNEWTLDEAAVFDYPAAVATILEHTGAYTLKALVHCQGSTSFMMSLVAGLLPQVTTVVSNAVSLHPVVPGPARLKALYAVPALGRFLPYLNPQWGISAPSGWPQVFDFYVRATRHECNNPVCKWSSFTFGSGAPTLWRHENLTADVHEWLKGEFAHVPMTFFRQMSRCIAAGHLVSTGRLNDILPASVVERPPRTDARVVLLAGQFNACFLPASQARTYDFLDRHAPGRHGCYELAGYGHLDVFIGKDAPNAVFPLIIDELSRG
ncbi:alpha/beta fold hydrolase [Rhizobium sp. Leaf453]|uniref:alpha/beta fold hydrolase n=1 Tax=Rhizobium sp. Leaf453 TaxID=1736380 RepID=UPI000713B070|nr:alpha/beta fold hydrolase [Rhizobium sp. Leaf453]KQU08053.1 esterase [Rhizobium sp. Leaf453]